MILLAPWVTEFFLLVITRQILWSFADQHDMEFESGAFGLVYSTPHTLSGTYKGRMFRARFGQDDLFTEFPKAWLSHLQITAVSRPNASARFSHKWLWIFMRTPSEFGDPSFERYIAVESKPVGFAGEFLDDTGTRQKVKSLVSPRWRSIRDLRITRAGRFHLLGNRIYSSKQLTNLLDDLSDLAQRVEEIIEPSS